MREIPIIKIIHIQNNEFLICFEDALFQLVDLQEEGEFEVKQEYQFDGVHNEPVKINDCDAYIKDGQFWVYAITYNNDSFLIDFTAGPSVQKCLQDTFFPG